MMTAVGVTSEGWGLVRVFAGPVAASEDPQVDVIVASPLEITDHYTVAELADVLGQLGQRRLSQECATAVSECLTERHRRRFIQPELDAMFDALVKAEGRRLKPKSEVEMAKNSTAKAGNGDKKVGNGKKVAAGAAGRAPKHGDAAKIRFLADKEKKPYGPDNNPLRKGSSVFGRFGKLRDGMTVGDYVKSAGGHGRGDLGEFVKRGIIRIEPAPAAEQKTA